MEQRKNTDGHKQPPRSPETDSRAAPDGNGGLIPKHGGYENTKSWQLADLIYDVTVRFCDKYVDRRSRTHDQMVQAARSGCQNLQEGSVDSAVSKKIEMKLTGIAKGSLKELQTDFKKFLKHRELAEWPPNHPALMRFKALRCDSLKQFRQWVAQEVRLAEAEHTDQHGQTLTNNDSPGATCDSPCKSESVRVSPELFPAVLAANGTLSLLNLCIHLIGRQMDAQAEAFEKEGGFTERLYQRRTARRRQDDRAT
jgi:four helix bundle suffix protein